jgi:two-component system, NarL family, nitrate/nitrite response regulator NarL
MARGRALIADPSALFREGLHRLVRQARFVICAEGRDISEALACSADTNDLALIICTLDAETGSRNAAQLSELHKQYFRARIIVIADVNTFRSLWEEIFAISDAILERDISSEVLLRSIDLVMVGQKFFSAPLLRALSLESRRPLALVLPMMAAGQQITTTVQEAIASAQDRPAAPLIESSDLDRVSLAFSDRERQILGCLVRGQSNKVIARELGIAEATVKVHVKGLLRKLRTSNRTQAAVWALNHGLGLNGVEVLAAD